MCSMVDLRSIIVFARDSHPDGSFTNFSTNDETSLLILYKSARDVLISPMISYLILESHMNMQEAK